MIVLCVHCLKPIKDLKAAILPQQIEIDRNSLLDVSEVLDARAEDGSADDDPANGSVATEILDNIVNDAVPSSPASGSGERTFTVKLQRLHSKKDEQTDQPELIMDVVTEESGVTPDDVQRVDHFRCVHCDRVLDKHIHSYYIPGSMCEEAAESVQDDVDDEDVPKGHVLVTAFGASNRFHLKTEKEVQVAIADLMVVDISRQGGDAVVGRSSEIEWDK